MLVFILLTNELTLYSYLALCAVDQFFNADPLFPPQMFIKSRVFTLTVIAGTCMAFVRGSITYIFIFFLQGPFGMKPLQAGE